jgi:hypothetical protein
MANENTGTGNGSLRYPQDRLKIVRNLTEETGSIWRINLPGILGD